MTKERKFFIKNDILPIIATYYPFGIQEINTFYENQELPSFDWVIEVCEYAVINGFASLESAEEGILQEMNKNPDIERKAMEAAFKGVECEALAEEVERLKLYTDQKLFAAASNVLQAWDDSRLDEGKVFLESRIEELEEAVKRWDSLPWKPGDSGIELPRYEA